MTEPGIESLLDSTGALKRGHFRLSSGRHSDAYIQCALLLEDPATAVELGRRLAERIDAPPDLVACPAVGALVIGFATALALDRPMVFGERSGGEMVMRRGFTIEPGARVLLVEDVITTGGSIMELARLVEAAGGVVTGLACLVERGRPDSSPYPLTSLLGVDVAAYDESDCPLCSKGVPLDTPGSRYLS